MTFICYSLAAGLLLLAYDEPDLFLMACLLLLAKAVLGSAR